MARSRALWESERCAADAEHAGPWERRQLHRRAAKARRHEGPLRDAFDALAAPERSRLRVERPEAKRELAELEGQRDAVHNFSTAHPEALGRLIRLDYEIDDAAWAMDLEREPLDGIAACRPELPQPDRRFQRDIAVPERAIELDRGFGLEL